MVTIEYEREVSHENSGKLSDSSEVKTNDTQFCKHS